MTLRYSIPTLLAAATCAAGLIATGPARAADFYAGNTLTFVVASDPGGGYDTYARLLARYIQKYIPGAPSIVVQDDPGAGGLRAAQQVYAVSEKDGTKVGMVRASNMLDSILGIRGNEIDPNKFQWIGSMTSDDDTCSFWHTSGVHSFQDLLDKEVVVGASGTGSQGYAFAMAINNVLHTKMKIIPGYKGTGDRIIAMQHGELQGNCGINASTMSAVFPQYLKSGELIVLMQSGIHPYPTLPDVPMTQSFAKTDEQKHILNTIFAQMAVARTFALPPGVPKDRVEILRTAFMKTMKDPGLLADAKKEQLDIEPSSGEEVQKVFKDMSDLTPELKVQVRQAMGAK